MDYYWLVAGILLYVLVLVLWPSIRRAWLIFGGTVAGMFIVSIAGIAVTGYFFPGWAGFGLMLWISPFLFAVGALAGFLLVLWCTQPPESPASRPSEER